MDLAEKVASTLCEEMGRITPTERDTITKLNEKFDALVKQGIVEPEKYGVSMSGPLPASTVGLRGRLVWDM